MDRWWEQSKLVTSDVDNRWWEKSRKVSDEEALLAADTEHKIRYARKALSGNLLPDWLSIMTQATFGATSVAQRFTGGLLGDADESQRIADAFAQASAELDAKRWGSDSWRGTLAAGARGAAIQAPTTLIAGTLGGPAGAIGAAMATEGNQAITQGRDAGLSGVQLASYAANQAAIEGGVAYVFQKIPGMQGLEGLFGKNATKVVGDGVMTAVKRVGLNTLGELTEENLTELGHNAADVMARVRENALEPDQIWDTVVDTSVQTLITMGAFNAAKATVDKIDIDKMHRYEAIKDQIVDLAAAEETPTRAQWKDLGLPAEDGRSAEDRKNNIKIYADGITMMREAAAKVEVDPDAPPTPDTVLGTREGPGSPPTEVQVSNDTLVSAAATEAHEKATRRVEVPSEPPVATGPLPDEVAAAQSPIPNVPQNGDPSLLREFFTDEEGRFGVNLNALKERATEGWEATKLLARRYLTTAGGIPREMYESRRKMEGEFNLEMEKMAQVGKRYDVAVKANFGTKIPPEAAQQAIDKVLRGKAKLETLPESLRQPVAEMRAHVDFLSRRLIASGAVDGPMALLISRNLGMYLHRSYEAFGSKTWPKHIPIERINAAKAWLRSEHYNWSEEDIQAEIEALLRDKTAESPLKFAHGKLGSKSLGILKHRENVPKVLRDLLGEVTDPKLNYMKSVAKIADLVTKHSFLAEVRDIGLQGGWFSKDKRTITDKGHLIEEISSKTNEAMFPLNGIYTTPEIADAFERAMAPDRAGQFMKIFLSMNGKVKAAKTVFSAMTNIRNLTGNFGFALMQGHLDVRNFKKAFRGTMTGILKMGDEEAQQYYLRATELHIVNQDVRASELRDYIKEAATMDPDEFVFDHDKRAGRFKKFYDKAKKGAMSVYQAEDDIWKLYAWEHEKARYAAARPDLSKEEIERIAARIVTDTYPTYSQIPEGIRMLRKMPIFGTFVSFPAEVIRTSYRTLEIAIDEYKDPRTRRIGATRIAGIAANMAVIPMAAAFFRFISGVSREEDDAMRSFLAPWQVNSTLMHLWKNDDGTYEFIDSSYVDPHSLFRNTFNAFLQGKDWRRGVWDSLTEFLEPFASEEILAGKLIDWRRNKKEDGTTVYNEQDTIDSQYRDIISYIGEAFIPGTVTSINRIIKGATGFKEHSGRAYNPLVEAAAMMTGMRASKLDVKQSLKYRSQAFKRGITDANTIIRYEMNSSGTVDPGALYDEYIKVDGIRRNIYEAMRDVTGDAHKLGVNPRTVKRLMKDNGATEEDIRAALYGHYIPYRLTEDRVRAMRLANPDEFQERLRAIVDARRDVIEKSAMSGD